MLLPKPHGIHLVPLIKFTRTRHQVMAIFENCNHQKSNTSAVTSNPVLAPHFLGPNFFCNLKHITYYPLSRMHTHFQVACYSMYLWGSPLSRNTGCHQSRVMQLVSAVNCWSTELSLQLCQMPGAPWGRQLALCTAPACLLAQGCAPKNRKLTKTFRPISHSSWSRVLNAD